MRRALLLASLLLAGCPQPDAWSTAQSGLDRVPLSAWGAAHDDVWFAGGGLGSGPGALTLHLDESGFHDVASGEPSSLWWVFGLSASDVWFVGEQGTALHWNGSAFSKIATPTTDTLYGIWGSSPTDLWAVGGTPGGVSSVLLHGDGQSFTKVDPGLTFRGAFFKVWGASPSCAYLVGEGATIAHFDGAMWTAMANPAPANQTLLTVAGRACDDAWAVGGFGEGIALHWDGASWSAPADLDLSQVSGLAGVSLDAAGDLSIVGSGGAKFRRPAGGAWIDDTKSAPGDDLHGTWVAAANDLFAVGGNFIAPAPTARQGIVAHYGQPLP